MLKCDWLVVVGFVLVFMCNGSMPCSGRTWGRSEKFGPLGHNREVYTDTEYSGNFQKVTLGWTWAARDHFGPDGLVVTGCVFWCDWSWSVQGCVKEVVVMPHNTSLYMDQLHYPSHSRYKRRVFSYDSHDW